MTGSRLRNAVRLAGMAAVVAAVVTEQRKPPEEREWHGRLGGIVPYDFRRPTLARVRAALWNPDTTRILTPAVFGVGWTLNVGRVVRLVRRRLACDAPRG